MADRYKIYEKLGAGGVGAVFRAYDSQLKRWVAVKRLLTANEAEQDKSVEAELRREADTLASLRNPNVVTIFDVASDAEGLFIVMELLQGEDLAHVVARGPLPYDDFKELASQTLEGLLAAHQHHILHRDIKPENIKVERLPGGRMQAKIIDFGLARAGIRARTQTEDQEGTVLGSIFYMAPEQLTREPVDERTDLYSLGCVFYEALSGKKAFDGESMAQVIDKHVNHEIVPLQIIAPHVPPWLDAWCMRLMAQKPADRPTSAQQAMEEFRAWERMPHMMPYMGLYPTYSQPLQQPMMYSGTGTVPLPSMPPPPESTIYSPVVESQPVAYAEPVLYAKPFTEVAAITTPLAVAPSRPPQAHPKAPTVPTLRQDIPAQASRTAQPAKRMSPVVMTAGAVILAAVAAYWFFSGSTTPSGDSGSLISAVVDTMPPKVSFQLPEDRAYPPADRNLALYFVSNTGALADRTESDGRQAQAKPGERVVVWHDLAERGGDNIFRVPDDPVRSPTYLPWPVAKNGSGPKPGRHVLDFHAREGQPAALELAAPKQAVSSFPFGSEPVLGDMGLTLLGVTEADGGKLPMRILSLGNDQGASVVVRVDDGKNLTVDIQSGPAAAKIVSRDVNGTSPCVWTLVWNANGTVEFRAKDADGRVFTGTAKVDAPRQPLIRGSIGRALTADAKASASGSETFQGFLAELLVYASALKPDQLQLLEGRLREHYVQVAIRR